MKGGFEELIVYKKAYQLAMEVFLMSKDFPVEEKYSLTDQIRRSSRSVCSNIAEGYRKRIYPKHFVTKISDADGECSETIVWLNFAYDCKYAKSDSIKLLIDGYNEIGRILGSMAEHPEKFSPKTKQISNN